jgi:uncharacterized protein YuzE
MSVQKIILTYEPKIDAAYIYLEEPGGESRSNETMDVFFDKASMHLDLDENKKLIGIEILGASRVLPFIPEDDGSTMPEPPVWE